MKKDTLMRRTHKGGGEFMDASEFKRRQLNAIERRKRTKKLLSASLIIIALLMLIAVAFAYTFD